MQAFKFSLAWMFLTSAAWAGEATLPYQGTNHWVAEADNAPLQQALKAAKRGTSSFGVILPTANRALSTARLGVLLRLLGKQRAGAAITVREAKGTTPPNTLRLKW